MLNVSRTVVDDCLARYDNDDCEVYFLNVTASEETLTRRLTKRAREPPEEIQRRVERAKQGEPQGPHVIHICNEATVVSEATISGAGALTVQIVS